MALRRWIIAAPLLAGLWGLKAAACPACAGRDNDNPNRTGIFLAAMVLLPWTVAGGVIFALRRLKDEPLSPSEMGDGKEP